MLEPITPRRAKEPYLEDRTAPGDSSGQSHDYRTEHHDSSVPMIRV
ncbi:hypothetical protein [Halopelagius fulvigenes]|uniref:Uncharacterized protein n=1 Tax=Halopelagius fulvigenes TaxID=1198324 RepID=A0ABD5TZE1_9EURY